MVRLQLDDRKWGKIAAILAERRGPGRRGNDNRKFVEAVLWWRRTGVPWRDLPAEFGPWKTVFNRFDRWSKKGRWTRLFQALQTDRDDEWHSIDTMRTIMALPVRCPLSSSNLSRQQTSSRAADSVAEPRAVR